VQLTVGVPLSLLRRGLGLDHDPFDGPGCSRCSSPPGQPGQPGQPGGPAGAGESGELPFGLIDGQWPITAEAARLLACDAQIIPVVLGGRGEVLDLGRATRTVTRAQRRALIQRDRHCAHPGCRRPPKRCAAHHVEPWSWDGVTDLDNLVLLCAYHHHLIHHSGWSIRMVDGLPQFIPPRRLDPHQRPRSNRTTQPVG